MSRSLSLPFSSLSPVDALRAQEALWPLLRQQARLYAPESTSLPEETAAALAESILLTLGADGRPALLLSSDLPERFRQGQRRLAQKTALSRRLWLTAWDTRPEVENRSLSDTLNRLKFFPSRYDVRFFAQETPCDIDYQLSQPVPETLRGVDYVNEWLRRLCLEQDFLRRLDAVSVRRVLAESCPDYRELLINLYEPAAVNALGLALLGEDASSLSMTMPLLEKLERRLSNLTGAQLAAELADGAQALCHALDIRSASLKRYLEGTAESLCPRLHAALEHRTLAGVFPCTSPGPQAESRIESRCFQSAALMR